MDIGLKLAGWIDSGAEIAEQQTLFINLSVFQKTNLSIFNINLCVFE